MTVIVETLVEHYLAGNELPPLEDIYLGAHDDVLHRCSKAIQLNRGPFEVALSSAAWEFPKKATDGFKACGRSIRCTLRSLLAADLLIRQKIKPLNLAIDSEERMSLAIQSTALSISSELGKTLLLLQWEVPSRIKIDENPDALFHAIASLEDTIKTYIKDNCTNDGSKSRHIAFSQLICDTGWAALDIIHNLDYSNEHDESKVLQKTECLP